MSVFNSLSTRYTIPFISGIKVNGYPILSVVALDSDNPSFLFKSNTNLFYRYFCVSFLKNKTISCLTLSINNYFIQAFLKKKHYE